MACWCQRTGKLCPLFTSIVNIQKLVLQKHLLKISITSPLPCLQESFPKPKIILLTPYISQPPQLQGSRFDHCTPISLTGCHVSKLFLGLKISAFGLLHVGKCTWFGNTGAAPSSTLVSKRAVLKLKWKCQLLSHVWLCDSMDCSLPVSSLSTGFPSPGDLPDPGIEPGSPALQSNSLPSEPPGFLFSSQTGTLESAGLLLKILVLQAN